MRRPRHVQVPSQVAEQAADRRVVLHAPGLAHARGVGAAHRGRTGEPGQQDPHLGRVQRRRGLVAPLQREQELGAQQLGQAGQGELVRSQQRPLGGDPGGQLVGPQRGHVTLAQQPVVVEPAQPAAADLLAAAAGDGAVPAAGQRPGPGDERLHRLGLALTPGTLVPEAQAPAVQLALATGHQAAAAGQRPDRAAERRGVELLPADPRGQPGPAAAIAVAVMVAGGDRAAGRGARPRRGPVAAQVTGE